ncbi:glycoside hydrolase superfamily [Morchella snyderi]|nr:glycoside hydrolase superfamily [Morchella snyderi]
MYTKQFFQASLLASVASALVSKDGVTGKLPALGWNSWNAFRCDINEEKFLTAGQKLIDLGLAKAGYNYVNIDDCWSIKSGRDNTTQRILPDLTKFPDGIDGTAKKIHDMGLKIGIYSDAGKTTCAGYPGSLYYEDIDAATWAEWGIDYLKYDNCDVPSEYWTGDEFHGCHPDYNNPTGPNGTCVNDPGVAPAGYDWSTSRTAERYTRMTTALLKQDRVILYSICNWGQAKIETYGANIGHSWRMTDDIFPIWSEVIHIINYNSFKLNYVDFWGHNDADMLEVGNGDLTPEETRSHFALWAAMKSPLLIGTSLDSISSDNLAILKNKYLLAFNQDDVNGAPAMPYKWGINPDWTYNDTHPAEYYSGASKDGTLVLMLNTLETETEKTATWSEVPQLESKGECFQVTNVWTGENLGCVSKSYKAKVARHDTAVLLVGQSCDCK